MSLTDRDDRIVFADFTVDRPRQTLVCQGQEIRLRARSFDVLQYLAGHAGRVVGKQELLEAVWGDVAVTDDSLVQCLVEIRRALGDAAGRVRTVRGRGYMLDAVPVAPAAVGEPSPVALVDPRIEELPRQRPHRASHLSTQVAAGTIVMVGALVSGLVLRPSGVTESAGPQVTMSADAREAFEIGRRHSHRRSRVELQRARAQFARAVAADPGFVPARAELAHTLTLLSVFGVEPPRAVLPQAIASARRAVELDPTYSFAWTALAHATVQWEWDWPAAEAAYRRAIALDPQDGRPRFLLAHLLHGVGRSAEALEESGRARETDPRNSQLVASNGIMLYWARRHAEARAAFRDALALEPASALAQFWMALNEVSLGDLDAAMAAALAAREQMGNAPASAVGYVHAVAGRRAEALEVLRALEAHGSRSYVSAIELAILHVGLGQPEEALDWLDRGLEEHSRWMEIVAAVPVLEPLHGHPRFTRLLRAMKLPDPS